MERESSCERAPGTPASPVSTWSPAGGSPEQMPPVEGKAGTDRGVPAPAAPLAGSPLGKSERRTPAGRCACFQQPFAEPERGLTDRPPLFPLAARKLGIKCEKQQEQPRRPFPECVYMYVCSRRPPRAPTLPRRSSSFPDQDSRLCLTVYFLDFLQAAPNPMWVREYTQKKSLS